GVFNTIRTASAAWKAFILFCYVSVDQLAHYLQLLGGASDAGTAGELCLQSSEQQKNSNTTGVATVLQLTKCPASLDSHFLISTHRHTRNTEMQPSTKTCPDTVRSRLT
ncbi:unnamed protein product, partial [Ectocarpus sp. 4 AP-2014]